MLKSKKGFTLIELIMVIVILAILAAVAIPRFIDLRTDARNAVAAGVTGGIRGTIMMLHSQYLIRDTNYMLGTTGTPVTGVLYNAGIQGVTVAVNTADPGLGVTAIITAGIRGTTIYTWIYTHRTGNESARLSDPIQY